MRGWSDLIPCQIDNFWPIMTIYYIKIHLRSISIPLKGFIIFAPLLLSQGTPFPFWGVKEQGVRSDPLWKVGVQPKMVQNVTFSEAEEFIPSENRIWCYLDLKTSSVGSKLSIWQRVRSDHPMSSAASYQMGGLGWRDGDRETRGHASNVS